MDAAASEPAGTMEHGRRANTEQLMAVAPAQTWPEVWNLSCSNLSRPSGVITIAMSGRLWALRHRRKYSVLEIVQSTGLSSNTVCKSRNATVKDEPKQRRRTKATTLAPTHFGNGDPATRPARLRSTAVEFAHRSFAGAPEPATTVIR